MNSTARFPAQWNGKFLLWMEQRFRLCQELALKQIQQLRMQENLPSLITLEKICSALGVTLSQFFQEGNSENLTEKQKEVLEIWNDLSTNEQETVMSMLRGLRK